MALERVPADIRREGGVARMSDPALIRGMKKRKETCSILFYSALLRFVSICSICSISLIACSLLLIEIKEAVTIPVMAKARIGHFVEAQILEALEANLTSFLF